MGDDPDAGVIAPHHVVGVRVDVDVVVQFTWGISESFLAWSAVRSISLSISMSTFYKHTKAVHFVQNQ